jgi:hypothetical protein
VDFEWLGYSLLIKFPRNGFEVSIQWAKLGVTRRRGAETEVTSANGAEGKLDRISSGFFNLSAYIPA